MAPKRKIFKLIDNDVLRKVIPNHSKRRKFIKEVLRYDRYVEFYEIEYEDEELEEVIDKSKLEKSKKPRKKNKYQKFVSEMLPEIKREYPSTTPQE